MRRIASIGMSLLLWALLMTGCQKQVEIEAVSTDDSPVETSIIEGSGGTALGLIAYGIASTLELSYPDSLVEVLLGDPTLNVERIQNHEADFALANNQAAFKYYNGLEGAKMEKVNSVATFYPTTLHIAILEKFGIETFEDFITEKPKLRISLSSAGSMPEIIFTQMLAMEGLSIADIEAWGCQIIYANQNEVVEMLPDGGVEMFVYNTAVPGPTMIEAGVAAKIRFVEISEEILSSLSEQYGYNRSTIPQETYAFMTEDIDTIATYNILIASTDVSEEVVYKVTKSINEQIDFLKGVHSSLAEFTTESFLVGLNIPVHPGALKYYREIGVMP